MRKLLLAVIYLAMIAFGAGFYFTVQMGGKPFFLFGGLFLIAYGNLLGVVRFLQPRSFEHIKNGRALARP